MNQKSKDFRQEIANMFVKSLRENPKQWRKEWFDAECPKNGATERKYNGINQFVLRHLMIKHEWDDPRFMTFKQANNLGYKIKKGSKGSKVEYWMPYDIEKKKVVSWDDASKSDGANITLTSKIFTVFNGSQIEGIPEYEAEGKNYDIKPNETVDKIASSMGVSVKNDGGDRAFYRPSEDAVHVPKMENFESEYGYTSTLAHELGHSTGHESRLDRPHKNKFGSPDYAKEELVAEITSCYLCGELGIEQDEKHIDNHTAYIQNWANAIEKDPDVLMKAVKQAEQATDFMMVHGEMMSESEYKKKHDSKIKINRKSAETEHSKTDEHTETENPKKIWVEPHVRNGHKVKGYWRTVK